MKFKLKKIKKINNFFIKDNYSLLLLIFPITSFVGSVWQAQYTYDGFHWGLLLFTAESLNLNQKIYNDIFIHYGPLSTILEFFILKIFENNIYFLFVIISFFYATTLLIIGLVIKKISNLIFALIGLIILFFIHPFVIAPWHNYTLFFFFSLYIFLIFHKNIITKGFSSIFLSFSILFSWTFLLPCLIIFIFDLIVLNISSKANLIKKIYNIILRIFIFFIPLILLFFYIYSNNLLETFKDHHIFPKIIINDVLKVSYFTLVFNFFINIVITAFKNFISTPQYFFFLILIIFNIFYLTNFNNFIKLKKEKYLPELLIVSFASIIFLYNTLNYFSVYKFSTGLVIGIIPLLSVIYNVKKIDNKIFIITFLLLISFSSFELTRNNSNLLYVNKNMKEDFSKNDYFPYFKNQIWDPEVWNNLIFLDNKAMEIKKKCTIKYAVNLTSDGYYAVIIRKYFSVDQKIPWYENNNYNTGSLFYDSFFVLFEKNFAQRVLQHMKNNELIILANQQNFPKINILNNQINFSDYNMSYIDIPYSYYNKKKIIIIPSNCKI